ncbi:hypothetical protein AWZ03_000251 [Drosophila navojoa]|uniref:Probable RNA-binding protein EIF1AD n=1 Tax=Drosophila navojoa TaxID=7232 RepID=A0A484BX94_DRONA|nr:probable RNA-binding protein EIF1AD [Drosophila navojoa]TDG53436.1 hypothetical protein AWZ03_000251 [Drosophila navojoa]
MSHPNTTRRKHVLKEMMEDDYSLPTEQQQIVRVVSSRGNNLHEVESATAENFLVSMPNKFRKNVWVKRGDYILVEPIEEGDKVKAEISKILTPEHIKEYTKAGIWPERFAKKATTPSSKAEHSGTSGSDSDESLPPNTNRPVNMDDDDEDETDTEESSAED